MGTSYYKSLLTQKEKELYDAVVAGLRKFDDKIPCPTAMHASAGRVIRAVRSDLPQLFFLPTAYTLHSAGFSGYISLAFPYSFAEAAKLLSELDAMAGRIVAVSRKPSDYETAIALHDYLARTITYSHTPSGRGEAHSIVGALKNRSCVCEGYAKAYKFLCDKAGIPCIVVRGTAWGANGQPEGHAWNLLRLGNSCHHVDVTFDKAIDGGYCSRAYLFLSTAEILVNHALEEEFAVPHCPTGRSPLTRVRNMDEFMAAVRRDSLKGLTHSEYALSGYVEQAKFMEMFYKKRSLLDILTNNRIGNFFFPDGKKINIVGIHWKGGNRL